MKVGKQKTRQPVIKVDNISLWMRMCFYSCIKVPLETNHIYLLHPYTIPIKSVINHF